VDLKAHPPSDGWAMPSVPADPVVRQVQLLQLLQPFQAVSESDLIACEVELEKQRRIF
jgi:hypothetical protein